MRIAVRFNNDVAIMSLSGKFLAGADGPFLRQKVKDLVEAGTKMLVINFSEVPYLDSTGLGFLVGSRVTAQNAGASLVLASLNPHVKKILDGVQLSQFFAIAENEAAALKLLKETTPPQVGSGPALAKETKGKKRPRPAAE